MNKLSANSSTVHLDQQEPVTSSIPFDLFEEGVRASAYRGRSFAMNPKAKSPAYVFGEQVLRPTIDNGYYYSCQLFNVVKNCLSYLDVGISNLFSIFPGVAATPVQPTEHKVTFLTNKDFSAHQKLGTDRVEVAFIAYLGSGNDTVSVVDTSSNRVVANVSVGSDPSAIAITPNSRYAYETNENSNSVDVIDTTSNKVIATIIVGKDPYGIAITPDGQYVYVANLGLHTSRYTASVIEASSNTIKATISLSLAPRNIAITPNGQYAYVTGAYRQDFDVNVIETKNNTILTKIWTGGGGTSGIAITPDGRYTYVASRHSVDVIDTTSNKIIDQIRNGISNPNQIAITPNGLYAYVTGGFNAYNDVYVIETTSNTVLTRIEIGHPPYRIAISPDGRFAYVTGYPNNNCTLSIINTASNSVIATLNSLCGAIAITPTKIPVPTSAPTNAPFETPNKTPPTFNLPTIGKETG
jgi:YVTN family beta-propeller protein